MEKWQTLTDAFVTGSRKILGDNLTGVYLHGSAAMGCFNPLKSDIDLLIVVEKPLSKEIKLRYLEKIVDLNRQAPEKGLEISVVLKSVCSPFVYPTPYELHFSTTHLELYKKSPEEYIEKLQGTDKDLAAHFTIILHRGISLYGAGIKDVFGEVNKHYYFDSILYDIENAKHDILKNPMYIILNLCRVYAYKQSEKILSKQEGGEWGLFFMEKKYHPLINAALKEYKTGNKETFDAALSLDFADYMLKKINEQSAL